jgi:L-asparagine transporter-like permease
MKTKLTFQLIKYIAILFFIYVVLIFFRILPSNETNTDINNQSNINKLKKLEAVCP